MGHVSKDSAAQDSASRHGRPGFFLGLSVGITAGALLPHALAWVFLHPPRHFSGRNPRGVHGLPYERVRLRTIDGVSLAAWYVPAAADTAPSSPKGVVVICHGYTGNRATMLSYISFLHDAGYAVVMLEFRAHGWSGGRMTTFGSHERRDLDAALDWVAAHPDLHDLPLALLGESMGAAVSLLYAADEPRVRAVVADSPFARFDAAVAGRLRLLLGETGGAILLPSLLRAGERILRFPHHTIAPEDAIARIAPRPVLLVHGVADRLLVVENSRRVYDAAPGNATLWEVAGAGHVHAVHNRPEEYARRIVAFLDESLTYA